MLPPQGKSASTSMEDLGKQIKSGINKVRAYAAEKIGRSESTESTAMPEDFVHLEGKMEAVRGLFDGLMRCTRQMLAADDYSPPIGDQFKSALDRLQASAKRVSEGEGLGITKKGEPMLIQDACADVCVQGSSVIADLPNKAPSAFTKYGDAMRKVAEARKKMATDVNKLFVEPFGTYAGAYDNASAAGKKAHAAREEFDTARRRLHTLEATATRASDGDGAAATEGDAAKAEAAKNAAAEAEKQLAAARATSEAAETKFHDACAEAVKEMDAFVQYSEATHCLDALAQAQHEYHTAAASALSL